MRANAVLKSMLRLDFGLRRAMPYSFLILVELNVSFEAIKKSLHLF